MRTVAIPNWDATGVIPPFMGSATGFVRSPYLVPLTDVVLRFATSRERRFLLREFLRFRGVIHGAGMTKGFQWLGGSFTDDKETIEDSFPNDIDAVTFSGELPLDADNDLLDRMADTRFTKDQFSVDHYVVELNIPTVELVKWTAYWSSVWSHRRSKQWKGFLEVDLDASGDAMALEMLNQIEAEGDST